MNKCVYVAELGINHIGKMDNVYALIDLAKEHGFDYVKFQKRDIDSCYTQEYLNSPRESPWGTTQRDQKNGLELSIDDYKEIDDYCKEKRIGWFYSPWDIKSAKLMSQFKTDYVKIAKACISNKELINYYNTKNDSKIIVSINYGSKENNHNLAFAFNNLEYILSCVSLYPSPADYNGLIDIICLKTKFLRYRIGYSNHSPDWVHPVIASYLGAEMIECHITLDKNMYGSDQKASLDDNDLADMMKYRYNEPSKEEVNKYLLQENEVLKKLRQTW